MIFSINLSGDLSPLSLQLCLLVIIPKLGMVVKSFQSAFEACIFSILREGIHLSVIEKRYSATRRLSMLHFVTHATFYSLFYFVFSGLFSKVYPAENSISTLHEKSAV